MYTHCPHCDTCFRVTTEQLKAARGSVRCGRCFGTFNALENLVDEPPQPEVQPPALAPAPAPAPAPKSAPTPRPAPTAITAKPAATSQPATSVTKPAPTPPAALKTAKPVATTQQTSSVTASKPAAPKPPAAPQTVKPAAIQRPSVTVAKPVVTPQPASMARVESNEEQEEEITLSSSTVTEPATSADPAREAQLERSQLLVEEIQSTTAKPSRNLLWLWLPLAILFTLALVGQYVWFNLASLAQQPQLRPALTALCNIAKCEIPLIKTPDLITLLERDIHIDPERPNVLLVKARIINKAPYTQAYPLMELSLHDITGHVLASRRFNPGEYLARGIDQNQGMTPQQVIDIELELADPGKEAVGFEFNFF